MLLTSKTQEHPNSHQGKLAPTLISRRLPSRPHKRTQIRRIDLTSINLVPLPGPRHVAQGHVTTGLLAVYRAGELPIFRATR